MKHHRTDPLPAAKRLTLVSTLLASALLVGCGGGGGGGGGTPSPSPSPSPTPSAEYTVLSGDAACGGNCGGDGGGGGAGSGSGGGDGAGGGLGQMRNVIVTVTKPDGTVLGSAALVNNLVSLYPGTYTGPIILEFADDGSGNGQYFDEAIQNWVSLAGTKLHVLVPSLTHHISANVLTETAYRYLKTSPLYSEVSTIDATVINEVNNAVRDAFNARVPTGFQVSDITNYAVAVSDTTAANSLPNTNAGRYGTLLAALALEAQSFDGSLGAPAISFMDELAADMVDDNTINASVTTQPAYDVSLAQALLPALNSARGQYADPSQPTVPAAAATLCFNPALFQVGAAWQVTYSITDSQGTSVMTYTLNLTQQTTFAGNANLLESVINIYSGPTSGGTPTFTGKNYYGPDLSNGLINYGSVTVFSSPVGGISSVQTVYSPPYTDRRFLLTPDSSDTVNATGTVTDFDVNGNPIGQPASTTLNETTTFVNYEDVTLPSGQTFHSACRYETSDPTSGTTDVSWITSSGQGVSVKSETIDNETGAVTQTTVMTTGTVNGQPVR